MAKPLSEQLGISYNGPGNRSDPPGFAPGDRTDLDKKYAPGAPAVTYDQSDGGGLSGVASSATARVRATAPGRKVFGFMAAAVLFSIIGAEIRNVQATASTTALHNPPSGGKGGSTPGLLYDPPLIFLAGTAATAMLVLLTETGSTGETLGVGLAGLSMVTAVLVNGGPVWRALSNAVGSKPTTPIHPTTGTTPSTSTTAAVGAIAPVVATT